MSFDQSDSGFSSCSKCDSSNTDSDSHCKCKSNSDSCSNTTYSSCSTESNSSPDNSKCSTNTESNSCSKSDSSSDSCSSFLNGSCSDSCSKSLSESCFSDDSCSKFFSDSSSDSDSCSASTSCSCDASSSDSCDKPKNKDVIDLATAKLCVFPTKKVFECGNFVGTRVVARGYIYEGCTICCCEAKLFSGCGVVCGKPQYPCKIIGTYELEYIIVNPEFNLALAYLFTGNLKKYLLESKGLAGRVFANASLILSHSDSADFYLPSVDTIHLEGRIPWGLKGQEWLMAVTGGTGDYKMASGQVEVERLTVANGSRTRLGESWRMCLDLDSLLDKPECNK